MDTSFKQQSHGNITRQHSITHVHFLSGWLPFHRLPLHNWTIWGEVYTIKSNLIIESVVHQSDDQVKIPSLLLPTFFLLDTNIKSNLTKIKIFKLFHDIIFQHHRNTRAIKTLLMLCLEINKFCQSGTHTMIPFSLQEASTLHFTYLMSLLTMQMPPSSKVRLRSLEYPLGNDCLK